MYFVLELSGSTTAVGGVLVLRLLPSAVGGPLAAQVVSRWNRRRVMLTSDLVRAATAQAVLTGSGLVVIAGSLLVRPGAGRRQDHHEPGPPD